MLPTSNVCVIPARGGSRRIPRKNIREFEGLPIIGYSITAAHATGLFRDIVVSTDDDEIAEIATVLGATRIHPRRPLMAQDEVGTQEVAADVLRWYVDEVRHPPTLVCTVYATCPLMDPADIVRGYGAMLFDPRAEHCYAIAPPTWSDIGQFYWSRPLALLQGVDLNANPRHSWRVVVDKDRACDINTEDDWNRALEMHRALVAAGKTTNPRRNDGT